MSSSCNNDKIFIGTISTAQNNEGGDCFINIIGVDPIDVEKRIEGDYTTYIISYRPYIAGSVSISVAPNLVEVGDTFNATYTANWSKGSADIVTVNITDLGNVDPLVKPNVSVVNGLSFSNKGTYGQRTITMTDSKNNQSIASTSIKVNYRYFIGTKPRFGSNENIVKDAGKLSDSMTSAYGSIRSYEIPEVDSYLVWLVPVGETMGVVRDENNFECETIDDGVLEVTNGSGVSLTYRVVRSKNFYASGETLRLKF